MKKSFLSLVTILFIFGCFTVSVFAAGECVLTQSGTHPGQDIMWRQYTCTADASDGSVPAHTITGLSGFYLYSVETWPGATAPTDASDLTLLDATTGEDLLGGNGTDAVDATTPKTIAPKSTAMDLNFYHMVKGNLTMNITNNSVNSAIINVRVTGVK